MTRSEYLYIFVNAFIYIVWITYYIKKVRCFNVGVLLLSTWTISAVCSLLYEPNNFIGHYNKISFYPFLFMFFLNVIAFKPVLSFRHEKINILEVNPYLLVLLGSIIGCVAILPFSENLIYLIRNSSSNSLEILLDNMNERYDDSQLALSYLSRQSLICTRLLGGIGLNLLSILLILFPLSCSIKKHWFSFGGIVIGNLNYIFQSYNMFARFNIAIHIILIITCLLILNKYYTKKTRIQIYKWIVMGLAGVFLIFGTITMTRMESVNDEEETTVTIPLYIGQYMCEGMPNFAADRYYATRFDRHEEMELGIRKSLLRENISKLNPPLTRQRGALIGPQFSTYIGNFYLAYGPYFIFVVFFLVSMFVHRFLVGCTYEGKISFASLYFFIAYYRILSLGICYNTYAVASDELVSELFIIPLAFLFEKFKTDRIVKYEK